MKNYFEKGTAYIVSSSHNDIAWMNSPYKTMEHRDFMILTPAINMIEENPNFKHTMECMLYLMEYLQRHPEKKEQLHELAKENRLVWGATYTQPYENILNDEGLVRQVYLGKRWFEENFPEAKSRTAWSPDVPGRSMQFPQILKKAGIEYLSISRINAGAFEWFSPDGSSVKGFSPGHYSASIDTIDGTVEEAVDKTEKFLENVSDYYEEHKLPPCIAFISVQDYVKPRDYKELIAAWPGNIDKDSKIPELKQATIEEFLDALTADPNTEYDTYCGERPNEWLYILDATHREEILHGRKGIVVLPEAEFFATVNAMLDEDFKEYPKEKLDESWKYLLYNDHGFGGLNGHITDQVFGNSMKYGLELATKIKDEQLGKLVKRIDTTKKEGLPIVVFNSKNYSRSEMVKYEVSSNMVSAPYYIVEDEKGNEIEYQFAAEDKAFALTIAFVAEDVPPMGYRTYYIKPSTKAPKNIWMEETHLQRRWMPPELLEGKEPLKAPEQIVENQFYKVVAGKGGLTSIFDKEQGREVLDGSAYAGFELFMMQSKGTGAGEFDTIEQATYDFADAMKNYETEWEIVEKGTLFTKLLLESDFSCCHVKQYITIYHTVKKIDCDMEIQSFDGTPYRELRLALPLAMPNAQIAYDVPMGTVEIGKDEVKGAIGDKFFKGASYTVSYSTPCEEAHPREVQQWIGVEDEQGSAMLSTDIGIFDYISPRDKNSVNPMIQPILLASRRSCHWQGNDYSQRGNHSYHFSLTTQTGTWRENRQYVEGENQPMSVVAVQETENPILPETMSFFSVDAPNIIISTVKKCEDDDSVIIRAYENDGVDTTAELNCFKPIKSVEKVDILEYGKGETVSKDSLELNHRAIETYKIHI